MDPINWNEIPAEALNPRMKRQALHTGRLTIARLQILKGGQVPLHSHENEQVTAVLEGRLAFQLPEGTVEIGPGDMLVLPPHVPHSVVALEDSLAVDTFAPRRQDWIDGDDAYLRSGSAATAEDEIA